MVFELFKSQSGSPAEAIEPQIEAMLATCTEVMRLAVSAFEPVCLRGRSASRFARRIGR
jgi:hypothetical protein